MLCIAQDRSFFSGKNVVFAEIQISPTDDAIRDVSLAVADEYWPSITIQDSRGTLCYI